jgi:hypothetical protein
MASVTLTPFTPWHAEQTASARALPAATLTGVWAHAPHATAMRVRQPIQLFMRALL